MGQVYVSITGLRLKSVFQLPRFYWHALHSMRQATHADGNLSVAARTIDGVHHTLSVWSDEAAMRTFLTAGAHGQAMSAFRSIATGKVVGFAADAPPTWDAVPAIWNDRGREV